MTEIPPDCPSSRSARGTLRSHRSPHLRSHRARILDQCLGFLPGGSRPSRLARRDTPAGVCRGIASIRVPIRPNNAIASTAGQCFRPPAATRSPLPTHTERCI
jgi:hypothetical protein